jgi:anti-anti-sigma factor
MKIIEIIQHLEQGTRHVRMSGAFTFGAHGAFRDVLEAISHDETKQIKLHFTGVDFIDSAALGMLLLARDEAQRCRKQLTLIGATGQVKKMLDMARFGSLFAME